jgi:outer membrane protein assembly factor BamB
VRPIYVSVLDGDTKAPVRGAVVRLGGRRDRVSRHGVARFTARQGVFSVTASAHANDTRTVPVSFRKHYSRRIFIDLYAASARTGRVACRAYAGGPISGAVVVDGIVYAGSTANRIIGVDARSGRTVFHFPHGEYVPVSGDGARLLLHGYSRLYAVEPKRK